MSKISKVTLTFDHLTFAMIAKDPDKDNNSTGHVHPRTVRRFLFFDNMESMMNSMASGMNYMMGKMTDAMNCAADVMMFKGCKKNNNSNIVQPVPVTAVRTQMPPDASQTSTAFQVEPMSTT
ncbi:hypothetical protein CHS0354_028083 [Potamilus streckersoni]|uniref:Uncharacterized protein n=1 Tax=Potamilus streckersoni TaxID=2493646 RepID=A0AAE0WDZ1_9BIVA|nr:hypothetical protein CHS0354_028083 [Potamilus streckersoni]